MSITSSSLWVRRQKVLPVHLFFSAAVLLAWQVAAFAQGGGDSAQIGISPSNYTIDLDGPVRTHAYRLQNFGERTRRVRVGVINWTTDENSRVVALEPGPATLDQWVIVNPLELDIPGGESRAVRFSIRPAVPLPQGEHRAALVFEEIPHPAEHQEPVAQQRLAMRGRFRITSAIYATVGDIERRAELLDVSLNVGSLATRLVNRGNGHVRWDGRYQIWTPSAYPGLAAARALPESPEGVEGLVGGGTLVRTPLLPGTERTLVTALGAPLVPGSYTVVLFGQLGSEAFEVERRATVSAQ